MKLKLLFVSLLLGTVVMAQNVASPKAQNELCKDWKIVSYEMFGTVNQLEDNEANDHIKLNPDFTCTIVEHGVTTTGKWGANNALTSIAVLPSNSSTRRVYTVQSNTGNEMKLMYQDSVLVKRIYHLKAQ